MKYSLCIDLLYLEIGENGPIFSDTKKLLAGMELAKKTGYQAVEFWDWDTRDHRKLLAKKRELNLEVAAICAKDRGTLTDPDTFEEAIRGMKETIAVAKVFDCPNIIVTADPNEKLERKTCRENIVEGLKKLAPLAEQAGVMLVLEPISGGYFIDSKEPFDILKSVNSPNVKLLYDIFHYQLMEGNIVQTMRENMQWIGHIHAAGIPRRNEITDGELNYSYILEEIKQAGYDRYFGIEYLPTMDKEKGVQACKRLLDEVLEGEKC
ncbi:MAG: TIM barrel protein [Suipraeoptans sp.]